MGQETLVFINKSIFLHYLCYSRSQNSNTFKFATNNRTAGCQLYVKERRDIFVSLWCAGKTVKSKLKCYLYKMKKKNYITLVPFGNLVLI